MSGPPVLDQGLDPVQHPVQAEGELAVQIVAWFRTYPVSSRITDGSSV
jgi:hypothetical protein